MAGFSPRTTTSRWSGRLCLAAVAATGVAASVSGQATHFDSRERLLRFIEQVRSQVGSAGAG